jgi:hypothetical protein
MNSKEYGMVIMMKKTKKMISDNWRELEQQDRQSLLGQKEYLEMVNAAAEKRIADMLIIESSVRSRMIELGIENDRLRAIAKIKKKEYKNKLHKLELEYIRQIHLLKSELYDRIIINNAGSDELKKVIEISSYTKTYF